MSIDDNFTEVETVDTTVEYFITWLKKNFEPTRFVRVSVRESGQKNSPIITAGFYNIDKGGNMAPSSMPSPLCPPKKTKVTSPAAIVMGYTGDVCPNCGSLRMKHSGTCTVCEDCGQTTGCS